MSVCRRPFGFEEIYALCQVTPVRLEVKFTMLYERCHVPDFPVPLAQSCGQSRFCTLLSNRVGGLQISVGVRSNHRFTYLFVLGIIFQILKLQSTRKTIGAW